MAKPIPISLEEHAPAIEIEAALVAEGLGLAPAEFMQLLENRKITQLCERGTGPDEGLYRASFYYAGKRVRLVVDASGQVVEQPA
ncbi:DUF6522 family protein [Cognatiluteimonas lumbrici]|uniref:DUF6522 family protein n=1 Tax=Cognatiluteimonas lumbrici TaxID=2559601 RepID=UPI00112C5DE0|nr:DUF6522 family protein [Luteimonas lumbrici]